MLTRLVHPATNVLSRHAPNPCVSRTLSVVDQGVAEIAQSANRRPACGFGRLRRSPRGLLNCRCSASTITSCMGTDPLLRVGASPVIACRCEPWHPFPNGRKRRERETNAAGLMRVAHASANLPSGVARRGQRVLLVLEYVRDF